ncbi:MAG: nucleotidyl transferase AbiEii/AbiGii toxin family protein [Gemmatimonadota bacterium]|nr:nucleotidyl transferase AbiEii/AbiGii toxin family protein [Gemmatimonadota bacterium]
MRQRLGIRWEVLERDYLLSWVLAGIAAVPELRRTLVFKGGTALKKCYFGDYRFSEDLDFSGREDAPAGEAMEDLMDRACASAQEMLAEYADVELACSRYVERNPHPDGQEAFRIRARLPWHRALVTPVKVEVTMDEPILWPVVQREVMHEYGEPLRAEVLTYSLEEVVTEKLRAILQQTDRLERRGWSRTRARDFYDLWSVLGAYLEELDLTDFAHRLHEKCRLRDVNFAGTEDFFDPRVVANVQLEWERSLGPLVPGLPAFETVVDELRSQIAALL